METIRIGRRSRIRISDSEIRYPTIIINPDFGFNNLNFYPNPYFGFDNSDFIIFFKLIYHKTIK